MSTTFEVEYFNERPNQQPDKRYFAIWRKGKFSAENLKVVLDTNEGSGEYYSDFTTLDATIAEAENLLCDAKFGVATIYDGKYRLAVVTKRYRDEYADSHYTDYGSKCRECEDAT